MNTSSGNSFTGMILVVLALFGAGGALVDHFRSENSDPKIVEPRQVSSTQDDRSPLKGGVLAGSAQTPGFVTANLANDGTGRLSGSAAPATMVALDLDGKTIKTVKADKNGEFSVELQQPLGTGKHVLQLKSLVSVDGAPVTSDQQLALNIQKDKDIIVTFVEPGQPPQVLQAQEDKRQIDNSLKTNAEMTSKSNVAAALEEPVFVTNAAAPRKLDQPNILFKETLYIGEGGKAGQIKLSGTAQAGAMLRFLVDGQEIGRTVVDKKGIWKLETTRLLSPGSHMLLAEQLNDKGVRIAHAQVPFDRDSATASGSEKSVWDRFTGIFKVEPETKSQLSSSASGKPEKATPAKREAGTNAKIVKFAFESISYDVKKAGGLLALSGRGIAGSRIGLFKGAQKIGEVVVNSKGAWTFSKRGKIKPGPHIFKARLILKSGRVASEFRMQYDHVDGATKTRTAMLKTSKPHVPAKAAKAAKAASAKKTKNAPPAREKPRASGDDVGKPAPAQTKSARLARPQAGGNKATSGSPSKSKKAASKSVRSAQKLRRKRARRAAKKRAVARYYLSRKNKAKYMARRKRYPKSRRTPTRVTVRSGTTLWGYSQHYYGRGKLYPLIQRANQRKIKNPDKIYIGQRIRVPRLRHMRHKKR